MAACLIGQVIVKEENRFAPYVQKTSAPIEKYGGQVLDVVCDDHRAPGAHKEKEFMFVPDWDAGCPSCSFIARQSLRRDA
jgi:uncharacterized protein (DUF1330 family)